MTMASTISSKGAQPHEEEPTQTTAKKICFLHLQYILQNHTNNVTLISSLSMNFRGYVQHPCHHYKKGMHRNASEVKSGT